MMQMFNPGLAGGSSAAFRVVLSSQLGQKQLQVKHSGHWTCPRTDTRVVSVAGKLCTTVPFGLVCLSVPRLFHPQI